MKERQSPGEIFTERLFRLPDYQRGISLGIKQLVEFREDMICLGERQSHYIGLLSIKIIPNEIWQPDGTQQITSQSQCQNTTSEKLDFK